MSNRFRKIVKVVKLLSVGAIGIVVAAQSHELPGQENWIRLGSGMWYDGTAWQNGNMPFTTQTAQFFQPLTYNVGWDDAGGNTTTAGLSIVGGNLTFANLGSTGSLRTHRVNGTSTVSGPSTIFNLGLSADKDFDLWTNSMTLNAGSTTNVNFDSRIFVGDLQSMPGGSPNADVIVQSTPGNLNLLEIQSGATLNSTISAIGISSGSEGFAVVDGAGSRWNSSTYFEIGTYGSGYLQVSNGGRLDSLNGFLGTKAGGYGNVSLSGANSQWNLQSLTVGIDGQADLTVQSGAQLNAANLTVAAGAGSQGSVVTRGAGSTLHTAFDSQIGYFGNGEFLVTDNAAAQTLGNAVIAYGVNSSGWANISAGSTWNVAGNMSVAFQGHGVLLAGDGGQISATHSTIADLVGSSGYINISGINSRWDNSGNLIVANGGIANLIIDSAGVVSSQQASVGHLAGSSGLVDIEGAGSAWNNSGALYVGNAGQGTVNVELGGLLTSGDSTIAYAAGTSGVINVIGSGSRWTNNNVTIGNSGHGQLYVSDGGEVITAANAYVALNTGSQGFVALNGFGSRWVVNGAASVGYRGSGELRINNQASIQSDHLTVGTVGGNGLVGVSGGSQTSNTLILGDISGGNGHMGVDNGGSAVGLNTWIGNAAGTMGRLTISGTGSTFYSDNTQIGYSGIGQLDSWDGASALAANEMVLGSFSTGVGTISTQTGGQVNAHGLIIGQHGQGNVSVLTGGEVIAHDAVLGQWSGSSGVVSVQDNPSLFSVNNALVVGGQGAGTINVTDGGAVAADKVLVSTFGGDGTITISGAGSRLYAGTHGTIDSGLKIGFQNGNATVSAYSGSAIFADNVWIDGQSNSNASLNINGAGTIFSADGNVNLTGGHAIFQVQNGGSAATLGTTQLSGIGGGPILNVYGNSSYFSSGGIINDGGAILVHSSDVYANIDNLTGSIFLVDSNTWSTIHGDINNQSYISFDQQSNGLVFLDGSLHQDGNLLIGETNILNVSGTFDGNGGFTGLGTLQIAGTLAPGDSPASVHFGGDLSLLSTAMTQIDLGGLGIGSFDQLVVDGNLFLNDSLLSVSLFGGHTLVLGDEYLIADIGGSLIGQYGGLNEGSLVGNFSGRDLFITYAAGDGNDIALFTAIPEPSSILILGLAMSWGLLRRRTRKLA